jgi:TolB-like protein/Flp pilus assembly protein TadD
VGAQSCLSSDLKIASGKAQVATRVVRSASCRQEQYSSGQGMSGEAPESAGRQPSADEPVHVPHEPVFISYASQDVAVADAIVQALERHGLKCWIAPRDVKAGALYADAIVRAISGAKAFVVVLSESAIASSHVGKEVERASSKKRPIIALRIDAAPLTPAFEYFLSESQWVKGRVGNLEAAYATLIDAIREPERTAPGSIPAATLNPLAGTAAVGRLDSVWDRAKRHKVAEWTVGYLAFGYALLQGVHLLRETFEWPTSVSRITLLVLLLGTPIAATLAWYHGHRARQRVSATELSILTALLLIAGTLLWVYAGSRHNTESGEHAVQANTIMTAATADVPARREISAKSVAVLPFVNMSEDKNNEYFSDGLSEELIDMLTKVPDLQVPARTSSFYFKGKQATIQEIAKALGVSHVLEGSVRKSGNKLRITAQLIRVDNGYHVWSETYDRQLDDIFKTQDEIADAVVRALKASLIKNTAQTGLGAQNADAYALYLQGRSIAIKANTKEEDELAADYFQRSLKIDPTLADAWAALSDVRTTETAFGYLDLQAGYREARRLSDKALELNPRLSRAHAVLARINMLFDWNWAEALAEYQKAYDLDPTNANRGAILGYAKMLFRRDVEGALRLIKEAIKLDPVADHNYALLGDVFHWSGKLTEAESAFRKQLDLNPNGYSIHWALGDVLLDQGDAEMALEEFQRERFPHGRRTGIVLAYDALGRKPEAETALAELEKLDSATGAYEIAQIYAARGKTDQAFAWLERAYRQRDNSLIDVHLDPLLKNLRDDPRYKAFLRKMNLPE